MKNKEIEEILNMLRKEDNYWSEKKHDYPFPDYYSLNREDLHLLLSYIEQLEQCYCNRTDCSSRIKDSKKYDSLLQKYKQLENNRDKAINYIDITIELIEQQPTEDDTWILDRLKGFKNILKGDSE